jgi:hypothetical protein
VELTVQKDNITSINKAMEIAARYAAADHIPSIALNRNDQRKESTRQDDRRESNMGDKRGRDTYDDQHRARDYGRFNYEDSKRRMDDYNDRGRQGGHNFVGVASYGACNYKASRPNEDPSRGRFAKDRFDARKELDNPCRLHGNNEQESRHSIGECWKLSEIARAKHERENRGPQKRVCLGYRIGIPRKR